jgi:hypothetical protein
LIAELFGADYGVTLSEYLTSVARPGTFPALADLSIPLAVKYGANRSTDATIEALWFIATPARPKPPSAEQMVIRDS